MSDRCVGDIDRCPNCGKIGFGHGGVPDGDISECGNGNCSVYLYWNERPVQTDTDRTEAERRPPTRWPASPLASSSTSCAIPANAQSRCSIPKTSKGERWIRCDEELLVEVRQP